MNTLNLRQAIIQRVHDKSEEELNEVIESSIGNDERTLPGLGVLFELIWQDSDPSTQKQLVGTLHNHLVHTEPPLQRQ
ncbi:small acid-soluble spore protein SspI [Paenibacillus tarimensis]|uniref:small acid-soluble spore protein SspI n=1 Tax=Paenibacillus tarimensis TaxID=416012 RepID=UPI001F2CC810|nr:small acid-soluble spore protein SspI [Paenibacillus tarimensis]MCF2944935.1 small acid-soluble spore protein SspI [Paenibacillus tarimensis]